MGICPGRIGCHPERSEESPHRRYHQHSFEFPPIFVILSAAKDPLFVFDLGVVGIDLGAVVFDFGWRRPSGLRSEVS